MLYKIKVKKHRVHYLNKLLNAKNKGVYNTVIF